MRQETEKWIAQTPVEALLCRDLRHAWPRPKAEAATGRRRGGQPRPEQHCPPSTDKIQWRVIAEAGPTNPRVLERVMLCVADCGVRRTELFVVRGDRLVRSGKPKLRYPSWYRRTRVEADEPLEPLDVDVLRGSIVARLYPELQW